MSCKLRILRLLTNLQIFYFFVFKFMNGKKSTQIFKEFVMKFSILWFFIAMYFLNFFFIIKSVFYCKLDHFFILPSTFCRKKRFWRAQSSSSSLHSFHSLSRTFFLYSLFINFILYIVFQTLITLITNVVCLFHAFFYFLIIFHTIRQLSSIYSFFY